MRVSESNQEIAVVIPCYRERDHILEVLLAIPDAVNQIYCVDDGCPDQTGKLVEAESKDPRVQVLYLPQNKGVGGAVVAGYERAIAHGAEIIVKLDGDGQMPADLIPALITPIQQGRADAVKGNRFFRPDTVRAMPTGRLIGNAVLSFMNKFSSGYWQIFDPTNGFVAVHADVLRAMPLKHLDCRYLFETELLYRLGTLRACVLDMPMPTHYGAETSGLVPHKMILPLLTRHSRNFFRRIFYTYYLRDFSLASIEWAIAPVLILFGLIFGITEWIAAERAGTAATAGTVMLAALPFVVGVQALLSALNFDIANQPRTAIHQTLLSTCKKRGQGRD